MCITCFTLLWDGIFARKKKLFNFYRDDDDINDVATMGGVNLSEESKNILASNADFIGTQIRSCKDEAFLYHGPLLARITAIGNDAVSEFQWKGDSSIKWSLKFPNFYGTCVQSEMQILLKVHYWQKTMLIFKTIIAHSD